VDGRAVLELGASKEITQALFGRLSLQKIKHGPTFLDSFMLFLFRLGSGHPA
jgi:hypothetical protein